MSQPIRILHLEDNEIDAELIGETVRRQGVECKIQLVGNKEAFERSFQAGGFEVILCDNGIPGYSGLEAIKFVRQKDKDIPLIMLSGTIGEERAVESLKQGANDYIIKNRLHRLGAAVHRASQEYEEKLNRQRLDAAMRLNEERLSFVLRATNDALWDWDIHQKSIWWNQGLLVLFGYNPATEVFDIDRWEECVHPADRPRLNSSIRSALESNRQTWGDEYRFRCSDQSFAHVFDRGFIMRDENGKAIRMIGSMMDITERKLSDDKIRRQAQLLDQTQDAIFVQGPDQKIQFWNAGAERLYGWACSEVVGQRTDDLFYADASQEDAREAVLENGKWNGDLKQLTKSGREIIVASRRTLLRDAEGNYEGILNINTDVTRQKELEVQFLQAQRLECIGALAGGIAHDLNNMLAPILMSADLLRGHVADPDNEKLLDLIVTSATRGADLIKQILAFSKGTASSSPSVFRVQHLITDVEKVIRASLPQEIKIETQFGPKTLPVQGDPTQVHQVLLNLCINARDAMPNGGLLRISTGNVDAENQAVPPFVWVRVQDSGTGIPQEVQNRIFDPFFTTKSPGKGTGLGLATVRKIVTGHGGRIEVTSKVGQGSAFTVYLPAAQTAEAAFEAQKLELPRGQGERVLVVEDEAALREILKATLESYGYRVDMVSNGIDALGRFRAAEYDLLLTDMNMPALRGADLLLQIAEEHPNALFVVMSGSSKSAVMDQIADKAAFTLQKPFSTSGLLNALRSTLNQRKTKKLVSPEKIGT